MTNITALSKNKKEFSWRIFIFHGANGLKPASTLHPTDFLIFFTDVTERKRTFDEPKVEER